MGNYSIGPEPTFSLGSECRIAAYQSCRSPHLRIPAGSEGLLSGTKPPFQRTASIPSSIYSIDSNHRAVRKHRKVHLPSQ